MHSPPATQVMKRLLLLLHLPLLPPIIFLPPKSLASFLHTRHKPRVEPTHLSFQKNLSVEEIEARRCDLCPQPPMAGCAQLGPPLHRNPRGVGRGAKGWIWKDGSARLCPDCNMMQSLGYMKQDGMAKPAGSPPQPRAEAENEAAPAAQSGARPPPLPLPGRDAALGWRTEGRQLRRIPAGLLPFQTPGWGRPTTAFPPSSFHVLLPAKKTSETFYFFFSP